MQPDGMPERFNIKQRILWCECLRRRRRTAGMADIITLAMEGLDAAQLGEVVVAAVAAGHGGSAGCREVAKAVQERTG